MNKIIFAILFAVFPQEVRGSCLGIPGACDLSLDEITLPGAHNAGAGFDGILKYHTGLLGIPALSCPYRNQEANAYQMLEAGIRYFDIDLCYEHSKKYGIGLWTCHSGGYGGKMSKFFDQVNQWMNEPKNRNDIVVLHFNRDYQKGEEANIEKALTSELKIRWNPEINTGFVTMQPAWWVKLRLSIKNNQRIYTFLHANLRRSSKESFLIPAHYIGYTWTSMGFVGSDGCKKLVTEISDACTKQGQNKFFVRLDLTLTWGLCNGDLAQQCNRHVKYASEKCYTNIHSLRQKNAKTINFIVLDYAHRHPGTEAVKVARELTMKYIQDKQKSR